jgi:hypothetical protein
MTKALFAPLGGALVGAVVGYSQWLCVNGQCPLTGTWWGGALLGALLGALFGSLLSSHLLRQPAAPVPVPVRRAPPGRS